MTTWVMVLVIVLLFIRLEVMGWSVSKKWLVTKKVLSISSVIISKFKFEIFLSLACIFIISQLRPYMEVSPLAPNIMTEIFFIPVTVILLNWYINKMNDEKEKKKSFEILRVQHSMLVSKIAARYITIIKKQPYLDFIDTYAGTPKGYSHLIKSLRLVISELDNYIDEGDFFQQKVIFSYKHFNEQVPSGVSIKGVQGVYAANHRGILFAMLDETRDELENFMIKYSTILPSELTTRLVELESLVIADKELVPWLPNVNKDYKIQDHIDAYRDLGNKIYAVLQYYREFY